MPEQNLIEPIYRFGLLPVAFGEFGTQTDDPGDEQGAKLVAWLEVPTKL